MIRALVAGGFALCACPAFATEWLNCADSTSSASVDLLLGAGLDVVSIAGAVLSQGQRVWASDVAYGPGDPLSVGQAFEDATVLYVDLMDGDFVKLAELRLQKAAEGESFVYSGTLRMPGVGAWAVSCSGA